MSNFLFIFDHIFMFFYIFYQYFMFSLQIQNNNQMIMNICNKLYQINVFYVKAIQWNLQNNFNIDTELIEYFRKFSTNVPYNDKDINYTCLKQLIEYAKINNYEISFDITPLNSGTIALVYKGFLNKKPIAIKILRNNIEEHIENGLKNIITYMNIICYLLWFVYKIKTPIITIISDNRKQLLLQCDMMKEIENIEKFQQFFINDKAIRIPKVYKEFTNKFPNLIIMEFLEGQNINNIDVNLLPNYYDPIQDFLMGTLLFYKHIHSDFHMGNIIFMENKTVGIIDFGMVLTIDSNQSNDMFNLFLAIMNKNYKLLRNTLGNLIVKKKSDKDYITSRLDIHKDAIVQNLLNDKNEINIGYILEILKLVIGSKSPNSISHTMINPMCSNIMLSLVSSLFIVEQTNPNKVISVGFKEYFERKKFLQD